MGGWAGGYGSLGASKGPQGSDWGPIPIGDKTHSGVVLGTSQNQLLLFKKPILEKTVGGLSGQIVVCSALSIFKPGWPGGGQPVTVPGFTKRTESCTFKFSRKLLSKVTLLSCLRCGVEQVA